jgi:hypothetical protein
MTGTQIRGYYADLAEGAGWRPDPSPVGLYSATKPAGPCPWWFVVTADQGGYKVRFTANRSACPATTARGPSGKPFLIALTK